MFAVAVQPQPLGAKLRMESCSMHSRVMLMLIYNEMP